MHANKGNCKKSNSSIKIKSKMPGVSPPLKKVVKIIHLEDC